MTGVSANILEKSFSNGTCTMRDLQFNAGSGEFVAIIGPSGTGKTTLLNMVAGLESITRGEIAFAGQDANEVNLSFMFQEPRLMPWLTLYENLQLVAPPETETSTKLFHEQLESLLEQVGLQDFHQAYPSQLSGGMQRRVALVRAFIRKPSLLLMDEPFQSLDAPTADQLRELLIQLWQETHATVLFVTHNLLEALQLADRVLFLSARPAQVILDYSVDSGRPRTLQTVNLLQQELLEEYPDLLAGLAD